MESVTVRVKHNILTDLEKILSTCAWKLSFESNCTRRSIIVSVHVTEESRSL